MYRAIERAKEDGVTLTQEVTQQGDKVFHQVTQEGFNYLQQIYKPHRAGEQSFDLVSSLFEQLKEKDRQIAEKDAQIQQLIEQARNYQVLLRSEQDKLMVVAQEKPRFLARLFGRKSS